MTRRPLNHARNQAPSVPVKTLLALLTLALTAPLCVAAPFDAPTATVAADLYSASNRVAEPGKLPPALRSVFHRLAEADTAVIPFIETRRMGFIKKPVELSGTMRYSKKAGLSIAYEQPKPRVLIIDDAGLIERQPDGRERRVSATDRPEIAVVTNVYLNLLRGRPAGLFGACEVYFTGTAGSWQMGLIPKDDKLRRHTGRVIIGGSGREIAQISNLLENGDTRTLRLSKSDIDAKFSSAVFQSYFRAAGPEKTEE